MRSSPATCTNSSAPCATSTRNSASARERDHEPGREPAVESRGAVDRQAAARLDDAVPLEEGDREAGGGGPDPAGPRAGLETPRSLHAPGRGTLRGRPPVLPGAGPPARRGVPHRLPRPAQGIL